MIQAYLFDDNRWEKIRKNLATDTDMYIFLDYDGTLVPIRRRPSLALLSPAVRSLIQRLAGSPRTFISIVTGRALADIKSLVKLRGIFYASNHGLEISFNGKCWKHPGIERYRNSLAQFRRGLEKSIGGTPGVFIENKRATFSIHYRGVRAGYIPRIKRIVEDTHKPFEHDIRITPGKKVIEARPSIRWDKGLAVRRLLRIYKAPPASIILYMGDDDTDADAFKVLRSRAMTIRVGPKRVAYASYYLDSPSEVAKLLQMILPLRNTTRGRK